MDSFPAISPAQEWTVRDLTDRLERGECFHILDVRNRDEFDAARIEGRTAIPTTNVPYFEMLETAGDNDDLEAAVVRYVETTLSNGLPREAPVLTVCAKGGTSRLVADALRHLGYNVRNLAGGIAAWGDFYEHRSAVNQDGIAITQIVRTARGCLSYLLDSEGHAVVVDPGRHIEGYLDLATERSTSIDLVIDTHAHADHISGGPALAAQLGVPYYLHPYDAIHPVDLLPARIPYRSLDEALDLRVGRLQIQALWIPGHTLGSVALLVGDRYLLSGDSIFLRSIARPDLGGHADAWTPLHYESLRRLLALADDTIVLPGHFSRRDEADPRGVFANTLGTLRNDNDGLAQARGDLQAFTEYIRSTLPQFPQEYLEIKRINVGLVVADAERCAELETGKNQCAMEKRT